MSRAGTPTQTESDAAQSGPRQKRGRFARFASVPALRRQQAYYGALFVVPGLLIYTVFMLFPFFATIYLSFTNWDGVSPERDFVGLANYARMFGDATAIKAFVNNVIWVVLGTIAPVVLGLLEALLVWTGSQRGSLFFRTLFFLPFVLPLVVVGIVWQWIYHPLFGVLNSVLDAVGLDSLSRGWLADPHAALQNVDISTVEASMIDGANWFQRARNVIIPQIAPQLTMVTAVTLIGGFAVFDIVFVMTGGGPGNASEVLATYTYKTAFQQNQAGYGSALAMLITLLSLVSAIVFVRLRERS